MEYEVDEFVESAEGQKALANAKWADPAYIAKKYAYEEDCIWLGRNPHNPDQAIGYKTEKHIFIAAESGGGKGRAFMVNNQALWSGSLIAVGPKGDEATITALRRGQGDDICNGLGQEVYVLDPMHTANVPEGYRAYYDLLEGLDPNDPGLVRKTTRIADAICEVSGSGDSADWQKRGKQWVARVIQHVITDPTLSSEQRNLITVRDLVQQGDVHDAEAIYKILKKRSNDPASVKYPDPYATLLHKMKENNAAGGAVSRAARSMLQTQLNSPRQFEGIRGSAADHFEWLEGADIEQVVCKRQGGPTRTFSASDIKDGFVSVFVHLPEQDYSTLKVWLRGVITSLIQNLSAKQGIGKNGHRVLFSIDEFGNLGTMDIITESFNSIRSAGVSLMLATQGITSLQKNYPKDWSRFPSAAGLEIYFQADEPELADLIEKKLGKTEVVKLARSVNRNTSYSKSRAIMEGYAQSHSLAVGHSDSVSQSATSGETVTQSKSRSNSSGSNRSTIMGRSSGINSSRGHSTSRHWGPTMFFHPIANFFIHSKTNSETTSFGVNQNSSQSINEGASAQRTTTAGTSFARSSSSTSGMSHTDTRSETHSQTKSASTTDTNSEGGGAGAAIQESFHIQPLLSALEARQSLISPGEVDHPAYPGMALVLVDQEHDPFFVRKSNYDQDPFFIGKFKPNPAFPFTPYDELPLLGWQITPDHFYDVVCPKELIDDGFTFESLAPTISPDDWVREGDELAKGSYFNDVDNEETRQSMSLKSPADGKIIAVREEIDNDMDPPGYILTLRCDNAITAQEEEQLTDSIWGSSLKVYQDRVDQRELEEEARRAEERERKRIAEEMAEKQRILAREAADQRARENAEIRKFIFIGIGILALLAVWAHYSPYQIDDIAHVRINHSNWSGWSSGAATPESPSVSIRIGFDSAPDDIEDIASSYHNSPRKFLNLTLDKIQFRTVGDSYRVSELNEWLNTSVRFEYCSVYSPLSSDSQRGTCKTHGKCSSIEPFEGIAKSDEYSNKLTKIYVFLREMITQIRGRECYDSEEDLSEDLVKSFPRIFKEA